MTPPVANPPTQPTVEEVVWGLDRLRRELLDQCVLTNGRSDKIAAAIALLSALEKDARELHSTASALYLAGRWECPGMVQSDEAYLWANLRDALKLPAGTATSAGVAAIDLARGQS